MGGGRDKGRTEVSDNAEKQFQKRDLMKSIGDMISVSSGREIEYKEQRRKTRRQTERRQSLSE
jgi:hypothetical protein